METRQEEIVGSDFVATISSRVERASPMPIKRVNRLVKQLGEWSERWIGREKGQIGFYEKELIAKYTFLYTRKY